MDIFILILIFSALIAGFFFFLLIRSVQAGQFDDLDDAAWRILEDDDEYQPRKPDDSR